MSRRVNCVPSNDPEFARAARKALASIDFTLPPERVEFALAGRLRSASPLVEVHRQHELARVSDDELWYAYRDGRPTGGTRRDPN